MFLLHSSHETRRRGTWSFELPNDTPELSSCRFTDLPNRPKLPLAAAWFWLHMALVYWTQHLGSICSLRYLGALNPNKLVRQPIAAVGVLRRGLSQVWELETRERDRGGWRRGDGLH
jgi:hypothetical protein